MGWPPLPSIRKAHRLNAVFSTCPALSNQNPDDLSAGGFFYTDVVLYEQKPVY